MTSTRAGGTATGFVALPDCALPQHVATHADRLPTIVRHSSGRPWLVGAAPADRVSIRCDDPARVVVLGAAPGTTHAGDPLAPPADCFLGSSAEGRTRLLGSASGLQRLFHARVQGVTIVSDRADILAGFLGAELDDAWLATGLIGPLPPHPLDQLVPWRGVTAVAAGDAITLTPDGRHRIDRWWHPPTSDRHLPAGAELVRTALESAVAQRLHATGGMPIGADFSGGMDSTSLTFLAARGDIPVVALTVRHIDPASDDAYWADRAARHLPRVERTVLDEAALPTFFSGIGAARADAPAATSRGSAVFRACADHYRAHAATRYLAGHGGDELFSTTTGYVHDLARSRPVEAFRQIRALRARRGWRRAEIARSLADRQSYGEWLAAAADRLERGDSKDPNPFGWGPPLELAPWATPDGAAAAAALLRSRAQSAQPLAPHRGIHEALQQIRSGAALYRLIRQEFSEPRIELPFLDDPVIDAALAVRAVERYDAYEYKPLLAAAMRDVVPDEILARRTKADTGPAWFRGLAAQRAALLERADASPLAAAGLVDRARLRAAIEAPALRFAAHLERTLDYDAWLTTRAGKDPT
ncbi:asparagine synthase-related protein [Nocardia sp. NPDC088792]|uniref:asparagine synthase-related protein n=1 Tax=Nocardia sp. NPDC088792 TaxID=3364332 RepID=UPI003814D762